MGKLVPANVFSFAYRAFRERRVGSNWGAFRHALTAVGALKKAVACDSTIYDAYMGIGSYLHYCHRITNMDTR